MRRFWFSSDVRPKPGASWSRQELIVKPGVLCIEVHLQTCVALAAGQIVSSRDRPMD